MKCGCRRGHETRVISSDNLTLTERLQQLWLYRSRAELLLWSWMETAYENAPDTCTLWHQ